MQNETADQGIDNRPASAEDAGTPVGVIADRLLVWAALFAVITSLIGLVATLSGNFHAPQVFLVALVLTILCTYKAGVDAARLPGLAPRCMHLVFLILVALIFRLPAYHYVMGGQDEGVYVNVAHYIEDTGGIVVHDRVKQQLEGSAFLQHYIAENQVPGGDYLAGVYNRGFKNGKLEFQFYHVFPVWMALFDGIFGTLAGVYALTFLAILSIVLFYRIALMLTGSYRCGLAAGGLLALSPLHAFFSKFPVTEVPALCFALIGFLFLAAFWMSGPKGFERKNWLVVSVFAFLCVFTTRISGFMYIPFFIALAWAALIFDADRKRCRALHLWAVGVTTMYLISVLYGLIWSHTYSHDIYRLSFQPFLGSHWKVVLAGIGAMVIVVWILLAWLVRIPATRAVIARWAERPRDWIPIVVVWGALLLGLIKIYRLGWTDHYVADPWLDTVWHLARMGRHSAAASSLSMLVVFLGPFLLLSFLALATRARRDPKLAFVFWFVSGFFAYVLLLQWVVPYAPYYARYLLSELVPYTILFVVCVWGGMRRCTGRTMLSTCIVLSVLYGAVLSAAQIGKNEDEGAYAGLARISAAIGPSDLVLLYLQPNSPYDQNQIKTPLLYTFRHQTVTVSSQDMSDAMYLAKLDAIYNNVFLLTEGGYAPPGFDLAESTQFDVKQYRRSHSFPHKLYPPRDVVLNLYRMEHLRLPEGAALGFAANGMGVRWLESGWSSPEGWGTWSSGNRAVLRIDSRDLPDVRDSLSLELNANLFIGTWHPVQRIAVTVNGKPAGQYTVRFPQATLSMRIPLGQLDADSTQKIDVAFDLPDAASPLDLGLSADGRDLAIGLVSASIESSRDGEPAAPHLAPTASSAKAVRQ